MESFNASRTADSTAPSPLLSLLEVSIPGVSLISKFLTEYLHIDISQYLGVVLLIAGASTVWTYLADRFWLTWSAYFMSTAEVRYNDEVYNYLMFWISKNGLSKRTSHFVVTTQTNSSQVYTAQDSADEGDDFDFEGEMSVDIAQKLRNWDRMKTLRFTPSSGTHYFRYKGHWLWFTRAQEKEQGFYGSTMADEISVSCLGRNPQILKDLMQDAQVAYLEKDGNKTIIYRGTKGWGGSSDDMDWVRCMSRPPREMSTVVLDEAQKSLVLEDMKEYLHPQTKKWYSNRGIPYRRGYLLHGPPGTGKTSLCFALAGLLQLRIYVAGLNSKTITEDGLSSLFRNLPARCIVLLEDIDAAGLTASRNDEPVPETKAEETAGDKTGPSGAPKPANVDTSPKGITLSGFLNIIDGVASSEGRILVMTTNHIEKLDAALLRPGRVDLTVHFGRASIAVLKGMFMAIYSTVEADLVHGSNTKTDAVVEELSEKPTNEEAKEPSNGHAKNPSNGAAKLPVSSFLQHHGKTDSEIRVMADEFARLVPADLFTPAEIQGYLLTHKRDPQRALDGVQEFVEKREAANNLKS
jgi:chaperone BCS1